MAATPAAEPSASVNFHVITAVGATAFTAAHEDQARKWLSERKDRLPGATVERVTVTTTREVVYRPRTALRIVK